MTFTSPPGEEELPSTEKAGAPVVSCYLCYVIVTRWDRHCYQHYTSEGSESKRLHNAAYHLLLSP